MIGQMPRLGCVVLYAVAASMGDEATEFAGRQTDFPTHRLGEVALVAKAALSGDRGQIGGVPRDHIHGAVKVSAKPKGAWRHPVARGEPTRKFIRA